ncbi:hypothetical protein ACWEF9_35030 [Streptomyces sp. NPDC004980]
MTTIAVTGHMDLPQDSVPLVRDALDARLKQFADGDLVGISCIARRSDSLFAEAVLAADEVLVLDHETANRRAYEDANAVLLKRADRLVAVWNGEPPTGKGGGTADVVFDARKAELTVNVVWPDGAVRAD